MNSLTGKVARGIHERIRLVLMVFNVGIATLDGNVEVGSSRRESNMSWISPTGLRRGCVGLVMALMAPTAHSKVPDGLLLDSSHGGAWPWASRAWLLEDDAVAPPAAWPLVRRSWVEGPSTPMLEARLAARPLAPEGAPWLRLDADSLRAWAGLRLEHARWRQADDGERRLREDGNGLDLEAAWGSRAGFWLHMRDAGITGDLDAVTHLLFQDDQLWLWRTVESDGSLTHDEQRAGAVLELGRGRARVAVLRDGLRWGSGLLRTTLLRGDRAPAWSQFLVQLELGPLRFSQSIGELSSGLRDSVNVRRDESGLVKWPWREKWLAAHRLEWCATWGSLALTELWVMGDRRPAPGAWLPSGFYWSEQHASGDRDNVLLGMDGRWRLPAVVPGHWSLHGELTLDDYSLSGLGGDEEGQRSAWLAGVTGCPLPVEDGHMRLGSWRLPGLSWWTLELTQVRPYVYGHFYAVNRLDHGGHSLGATEHPNSRALDAQWLHELGLPHLTRGSLELRGAAALGLTGSWLTHGANPPDRNVGGNRMLPHREGLDPPTAPFLDGLKERRRMLRAQGDLDWSVFWRGRLAGHLSLAAGSSWLLDEPAAVGEGSSRSLDGRLTWTSPF